MNLYVGDYWVPFPSSEYGGMWVVMAENETQCAELLKDLERWNDDYSAEILEAVKSAKVFQLDENVASNREARIVDSFLT